MNFSYNNDVLTLVIPGSFLEAAVNQELGSYNGRLHNTEFNRIDVSNLCCSIIEGGCRAKGDWRFQNRQRAVFKFWTRSWSHFPWVSMSGNFYQDLAISVSNGKLNVTATNNNISSCKWYTELISVLSRLLNGNGLLRKIVYKVLQNKINGMDILFLCNENGQ